MYSLQDVPNAAPGSEAVVDLAAIAHNTRLVADRVKVPVLAVVKADGFGHGAVAVAETALANGASWLGVTSVAEARHLRLAGIRAPILSWLPSADQDFRWPVAAEVDLSVSSIGQLAAVADAASRVGRPAMVHLKIDTGLSRSGATRSDWLALVTAAGRAERSRLIRVRGLWSHLATADVPGDAEVNRQLERFCHALELARGAGLDPAVLHLANSAGALQHPATRLNLVRVGAALYGVEPVVGRTFGLQPAMTLRSRVILTKVVPARTGVSYRHTYRTARATRLALIPLGYADGIPSRAGNRAQVWVRGRRYPVVGRVAMDQLVVDLGCPDAEVAVGDEVIVFGPGEQGEPTVSDWAGWADCVPQELLTGIGPRVARRTVAMELAGAHV